VPPAIVLVGAAIAGFVQGVSGFALALVAAAFWSGAMSPQVGTPLVVLCSFMAQLQSIRRVLPHFDRRLAWPMALGGLVGLPIGIALLPLVDAPTLRLTIGILLCVYCPAMLLMRSLPAITWGGRPADAAIGALGGIMGGLAGLSGPPPTLWCNLRGWPPDVQRATFQVFLVVVQGAGLIGYALTGLVTTEVLRLGAWILPLVLAGSFAGSLVYTRMKPALFRRIVLGLLLLNGLALVAEAAFAHAWPD